MMWQLHWNLLLACSIKYFDVPISNRDIHSVYTSFIQALQISWMMGKFTIHLENACVVSFHHQWVIVLDGRSILEESDADEIDLKLRNELFYS